VGLWRQGGGGALLEGGEDTAEHRGHLEAFCSKLLAEALHELLNQSLPPSDGLPEDEGAEELEAEIEERTPDKVAEDLRRKEQLEEVRKKDAPEEGDVAGQKALERAQHVQGRLVQLNFREGKPQVLLVSSEERLTEAKTWPVPTLSAEVDTGTQLYGNLYPHAPPMRQRCVVDDFATPDECRDVCGHCVRGMHCMFRRCGQTSLAVSRELLTRRMGDAGAQAICGLVERVRRQIIKDFGLTEREEQEGRPVLFESGALLTRLQAEWARDMWEITGEEDYAYWNVHVDKANVASYDYAALLYLNTQGEHFSGGDFAFVDAEEDQLVAPRRGRLLTFTAGPENLHQVRRVTKGTRFVLAMWYTLSEKHQRGS